MKEGTPIPTYGGMTAPSIERYVQTELRYRQASATPPNPREPYRISGSERLGEQLASPSPREVVVFNCIDFKLKKSYDLEQNARYPEAYPIVDNPLHIAEWYQQDLKQILDTVQLSGPTNLTILVPDSEFNRKVMNFPDSDEVLSQKAQLLKKGITEKLGDLVSDDRVRVETITEYCKRYNLPSPAEVTDVMYERITGDPKLMKKIREAEKKDVRGYFMSKGLPKDYVDSLSPAELQDRLAWYYAMYMAEGKLLADGNTMMIDVESNGRVRAWMERGSEGQLPIITAVNTATYKTEVKRLNTDEEDRV